MTDDHFENGLDFMIQNEIILIPGIDHNSSTIDDIPPWFRNTAHWGLMI
jgi:hypothetical protein